MYNQFKQLNKSEKFLTGYVINHQVYFSISDDIIYSVSRESTKKGGAKTLRFRPTTQQKNEMLASAIYLMTEQEFNLEFEKTKYNKGETFERLIFEKFNQVWVKDSTPFYEGPDIYIKGVGYSIKFQGATLCSEKTLRKLGNA